MSSTTPANWYPDPEDPSQLRYWDGSQWTEHRAPGSGSGVATPPASDPGAPPTGAGPASTSDTSDWPTPWQPDEPAQPAAQPYPGQTYPYATAPAAGVRTNGLAVTSLIVGIVSIFAAFVVIGGAGGVIAIVLGAIAINQVNAAAGASTGKGMAISGIITGVVAVLIAVFMAMVFWVFSTAVERGLSDFDQWVRCMEDATSRNVTPDC